MNNHTLIHHFLEQSGNYPDRVALVHNQRRVTYGALAQNAAKLAGYLLREGQLAPEQLVGVHGARTVESVTAMLGILQAGGAYVPLPLDWPLGRTRAVMRAAGLRLVFTDGPQFDARGDIKLFSTAEVLKAEKVPALNAAEVRETQLAYVMFTSGSTGTPKGAMIEHRSVLAMLKGFE